MKKTFSNFQSGFTLLELVVSIGVLAILAIFAIASLNPLDQFKKARDSQRKSDLAQIQRALESFYQDNGKYPNNSSTFQIEDVNNNPLIWGGSSGWLPYMTLLPKDPDSLANYVYYSLLNGQEYRLYAYIERGPEDPQTCMSSVLNCHNNPTSVTYCSCTNIPVGANCGSSTKPCNFGLTSPNTSP